MQSILSTIGNRRVVLCAGPGGVGKTTTSAAIAVAAACAGKRVVVLTIDPAKRLADALGVGLDNEPRRIDASVLGEHGACAGGELWAVMLDATRTFDEVIRTLSPSSAVAERIFANVIYRQMSRALAGAVEYAAIQKLYEVRNDHDFDLIVVDTPPSKSALDFIDAPHWLSRFLDERIFRWFLRLDPTQPGGGFRRSILRRTGRIVWDVLSRVFGSKFVADLSDFVRAVESLTGEVRRRADVVWELLRSPETLVLVVATPDPSALAQAAHLRTEIVGHGLPFGGFIVNRTWQGSGLRGADEAAALVRRIGAPDPAAPRLADKLTSLCADLDLRAQRDGEAVDKLRRLTGWHGFLATLPRQLEEINDLVSLHRLSLHLHA